MSTQGINKISLSIFLLLMSCITFAEDRSLEQRINDMEIELEQMKSKEHQSHLDKIDQAGEWLQSDTLIHLSGYADVGYQKSKSKDGSFTAGKFAPIFHFQYRDIVMLESELEIETEDGGETDIKLEYLAIDWFVNDYMVFVAGKFLSPIGQFRQNLHPSWINKLPSAPPGFGHDGAAPISDVGAQIRGGLPLGSLRTTYALYVSNGPELNAVDEDGEIELEGIEAEGFGNDNDGEKTYGGRFSVLPLPNIELGFSAARGKASVTAIVDEDTEERTSVTGEETRDYAILGADYYFNYRFFEWRGEYVKTDIGEAKTGLTSSEKATWETWYTQVAYRINPTKWEAVIRYTDFNSPHNSEDQKQWALGANYLFASNFVGKIGYEVNDGQAGKVSDQNQLLLQLTYGF
jgi:hypothetical protein